MRSQLKANPFQHTVHLHSTHQNWGTTSPLTDIHTSVLHSRKGLMFLHQPLTIAKIQHVVGLSCDYHVIVDDFNHFGKICHCKSGFSKHILYYFTEAATYDIHNCGYGVDGDTISLYRLLQNGPLLSTTCKTDKSEMYSC